jgi:glycosyltransferase involved in cell wall biosynthesis
MRILHISTRLILGGSQENTVLSCEGQARQGHDVHLAFGPILGPEGSMLARVEGFRTPDDRRITTHLVPHMVRQVAPLADRAAKRELLELIRALEPDVVHTHSSKAGILGRYAAWRVARTRPASKPLAVVHTIHGPPFMPIEGSALTRARIRAINHAYALAERLAAQRCHAIISVADAMTSQFLSRGIGTPALYTTVRSGMDLAPFLAPPPEDTRERVRASLGLAPEAFVVGTVARLAQHKGHDDLLDALAPLLRARPEWTLLWVGDGWRRRELVDRARALGLSVRALDKPEPEPEPEPEPAGEPRAHIVLTGLVPPERVPSLLRAMDVLAHPSSREGLPRTVPQALLAGVCPVAYDVDGTREACVHESTGLLVPHADTRALRDAIERLYADPALRARLASQGRERCAREFGAERMIEDLGVVYAHALERAREAAAE